jgi:predicted enzyme related to lactoylglutathione lyase
VNTVSLRAACSIIVSSLALTGCAEEAASIQLSPSTMADAGAATSDARVAQGDGSLRLPDAAARADASTLPSMHPYAVGAGIGVSDLAASAAFYEEILHLDFAEDVAVSDRKEKLFKDVRGNTVALMDFEDERRTEQNPAKLVFAVKSAQAAYDAVLAGGGSSASAPSVFAGTTVALAYDPDKYLVELIEAPTVPENKSVLVGVGIGVSSLDESADYYTNTVGLMFRRDIKVPNFMDEKELGSLEMRGLSVVLMHYLDETKDYKDVPVKIVLTVPDAKRYAKTIGEANADFVLAEPKADAKSRALIGMARDLEGYWLQFQQPPSSAP